MDERKPKTSWWGITALILGLISIVFGPYTAIPAVIIGHIAIGKIKAPEKRGIRLALIGTLLGYFWTISPTPMFFGAKAAMRSAKKADAANTAYNLRNAMAAYYSEYRRFYPDSSSKSILSQSDGELMSVFTGADTEHANKHNPRGIAFFASRPARQIDNENSSNALTPPDGAPPLYDPWGNLYQIRVNSLSSEETIQIWSFGPDKKDQTNDDIKTW